MITLQRDVPSEGTHSLSAEEEPYPEAARGQTVARGDSIEPIKDPLRVLRGDAGAVVGKMNLGDAVVLLDRDDELNAVAPVLERIINKIVHNATQIYNIGINKWHAIRESSEGNGSVGLRRGGLEHGDAVAQESHEVDARQGEYHFCVAAPRRGGETLGEGDKPIGFTAGERKVFSVLIATGGVVMLSERL